MKILGCLLGGVVSVLVLVCLFSFINHVIQLKKENASFVPMGELVTVNGHNMHIYTEGEGKTPLIFMSGGGTSSPVLDFKSLYSLLSDDYQIVVIEKFGYGFSDIVDIERDLDSILSNTREALASLNIEGPYILFPHSMSGIEALYWAQRYPNEVKAIVGLDMAFPDAYVDYEINMPLIHLSSFAAKLGVTRFIPNVAESDAIKYGTLTDVEKQVYRSVFFRRTATQTMLNEVKEIKRNAQTVAKLPLPNVPLLLFVSNGFGTGWEQEKWVNIQEKNAAHSNHSELIYLNCPHYVHNFEYETIATSSKQFINALESQQNE